jgi:hypothetical protein
MILTYLNFCHENKILATNKHGDMSLYLKELPHNFHQHFLTIEGFSLGQARGPAPTQLQFMIIPNRVDTRNFLK